MCSGVTIFVLIAITRGRDDDAVRIIRFRCAVRCLVLRHQIPVSLSSFLQDMKQQLRTPGRHQDVIWQGIEGFRHFIEIMVQVEVSKDAEAIYAGDILLPQ